jgi:hypothetical protein
MQASGEATAIFDDLGWFSFADWDQIFERFPGVKPLVVET